MELFCASYFRDGIGHLGPEESNHCIRVLRHREGDMVEVIDGAQVLNHIALSAAGPHLIGVVGDD